MSLSFSSLIVDKPALAWAALADFEKGTAGFADCMLGHANHAAGCVVTFTFDKKAGQIAYFELVT